MNQATNPAEQYVLEKVQVGELADLAERFPKEDDRELGARFLEDLLTDSLDGVNVHRKGVRIKNATVIERIDLENAEIVHETYLDYCVFQDDVIFSGSHFRKDVTFEGSLFKRSAQFVKIETTGTISIEHAIFEGSCEFNGANVAGQLLAGGAEFRDPRQKASFYSMKVGDIISFREAVFEGPVNFGHIDVSKNFESQNARFNNTEQEAVFAQMRTGDSAFFNGARFAGPVSFGHADIRNNFEFQGARFNNKEKEVIFAEMSVGDLFLTNVRFEGGADFHRTSITGDLHGSDLEFRGVGREVNFASMQVQGTVFFDNTTFLGPADLTHISIGRHLQARNARFEDDTQSLNMNGGKVDGGVFLAKAQFAGPVEFQYSDISGTLQLEGSLFKKRADFNRMKVGYDIFLIETIFDDDVRFQNVEISGQLQADGAQFADSKKGADFNSMRVGSAVFFRNSTFRGTVSFGYMNVKGNFEAQGARFINTEKIVRFDCMKVGGNAFFEKAVFAGPVSMADALFDGLLIGVVGTGDAADKNVRLDLSRTIVKRELRIWDTKFETLIATLLQVEASASLNKVSIENDVSLEHSRFLRLKFSDVSWPSDTQSVRLEGMKYEHIEADDGADSWEKLLEMAEGARYNVSVYSNLEEFFKQQGHGERANKVFVARKRRERRETSWWAIHKKLAHFFLDYSVRYGRSPARAFGLGAIVILIGCGVFWSQGGMVLQNPDAELCNYGPFWYSVDLFVPFIDLKAASAWIPGPENWFGWLWMRIQMILGWILIPTGIAAWTGLIK